MISLKNLRCKNHPEREAVAKCNICGHFYCRECITEHNGKMVCGNCIREQTLDKNQFSSKLSFKQLIIFLLTFLMLWLTFYISGEIIYKIPQTNLEFIDAK